MSIGNTRWQRQLLVPALALGLLSACSDDDDTDNTVDESHEHDGGKADAGKADAGETKEDAGETELDASVPDAEIDGATPDAETPDATVPAKKLTEIFAAKRPLSASQSDRFWTATFDANGKVLAAGYVTDVVDGTAPAVLDKKLAVARFNIDGSFDTTFGDVDPLDATKRTGIARINVSAATTVSDNEAVRGIAVQKDGKIVVGGHAETGRASLSVTHETTVVNGTLPEVDVVVARLTTEGALDTTFSAADADGKAGIWVGNLASVSPQVNVGTDAAMTKSLSVRINDEAADLRVDSQDRIVLFARGQTNAASRVDADRITLRLLKEGAVDNDFGTAGRVYTTTPEAYGDNARNGVILPNDEILVVGYTRYGAPTPLNHIVVSKLTTAGLLAPSFNGGETLVTNPFANTVTPALSGRTEAYGAGLLPDGRFVTTGYGGASVSETVNQMLSCRFSAAGALDTTFGDTGCNVFDTAKGAADKNTGAEQGRNVIALPDDRLFIVGNATTTANDADGVAVLLTKDGKLDTSFNEAGNKTYSFGLRGDQLWGLALSNDKKYVVATGFSGAGGALTTPVAVPAEAASSEDSALVIYELKD